MGIFQAWLAFGLMACPFAGCGGGNQGGQPIVTPNPATPTAQPAPAASTGDPAKPGSQPATPEAKPRSVKELVDEFKPDPKAWDKEHRGKPVVLRGTVAAFGRPPDGKVALILDTEPIDQYSVWAYIDDAKPWNKVLPGQMVTVRGVVGDSSVAPNLERCEISEVSGPAPASFEATKIVADRSDFGFADQNFGKHVIVSGKVGSVAKETSAEGKVSYTIELQPLSDRVRILVHFPERDGPALDALKADEPIRFLAHVDLGRRGEISLSNAILLDAAPVSEKGATK